MSTTQEQSSEASGTGSAGKADMRLEVLVIPVSDVDRAKEFYGSLGWRLDADRGGGDFRLVQFTPPAPGVRSSSARISPRPSPVRPRRCSWPDRRRSRDGVRFHGGPGERDATRSGRARRARKAHRRGRPGLARLVRRIHGGRAGRDETARMSDYDVIVLAAGIRRQPCLRARRAASSAHPRRGSPKSRLPRRSAVREWPTSRGGAGAGGSGTGQRHHRERSRHGGHEA